MAATKLTDEQAEELVSYANDGVPAYILADIYGVSVGAVYYLRDHRHPRKLKLTAEQVKEIVQLVNSGESTRQVARKYNVSGMHVWKIASGRALRPVQCRDNTDVVAAYLRRADTDRKAERFADAHIRRASAAIRSTWSEEEMVTRAGGDPNKFLEVARSRVVF